MIPLPKYRLSESHLDGLYPIVLAVVVSAILAISSSLCQKRAFEQREKILCSRIDSLIERVRMVRDSADEAVEQQVQLNGLWWMHRCQEDVSIAREAMARAFRGAMKACKEQFAATSQPATGILPIPLRQPLWASDSATPLPADIVGGPSLY